MKVYAALVDDISDGHVWLEQDGLPARCIVRISNIKKSVYCEALQFDKNFLTAYKDDPTGRRCAIDTPSSSIVMSYWYRARLGGLETQRDYTLQVVRATRGWGELRACMQHPHVVVRVAVWLALLSVGLGAIGAAPVIIMLLGSTCGLIAR